MWVSKILEVLMSNVGLVANQRERGRERDKVRADGCVVL